MRHILRFRRLGALLGLAGALLAGALPALAQSNTSAVAPFHAKAAAPAALALPAGAPGAARISLPAVDPARVAAVKRANGSARLKRLQVGLGRDVAADSRAGARALTWRAVDGGLAAQWEVTSQGARALRVGLAVERIPAGAQVRVTGSESLGVVYGPFSGTEIAAAKSRYWWTPVVEGQSATVEVFLPADAAPSALAVRVARVSHLFVSPSDPKAEALAKIGESGTCEVDVVCRSASDATLANTAKAVARMEFVLDDAKTYLCTGTLLNPTDGSFIPYFYSANHCMVPTTGGGVSTQAAADTLETFWFYDATGCGSGILNPGVQHISGGATLLYANESTDGLLLRLRSLPPSGAVYAGWNATPVSQGAPATAIHHPKGDVKKVSLGTAAGFESSYGPGGSMLQINWNSLSTGVTEPGSSGSGIFTALGSPAADYQLRGGLYGGASSCTAGPSELWDVYSRLDQVYPAIKQYIDPPAANLNYTALWWNPNESGWGVNFTHQGDIIFATLFTYDANGDSTWYVMSDGARQGTSQTFSGTLYQTRGLAFYAPYQSNSTTIASVGTMTVTFTGADTASLTYSVNGSTVVKTIQKQVYGSRAAQCQPTSGDRTSLTNYQDLWWNQDEPGWGINITHEDDTIFATLFTYKGTGDPLWFVMSSGVKQPDGSYLGDLYYVAHGPPFNAQPFGPIAPTDLTRVGYMRLSFTNGDQATLTYTYNNDTIVVTKNITRQVFASPMPACTS